MMEKNVYLLIPDLHMGNIKAANRKDYRREQINVQQCMLNIAVKYKLEDCNVITLFLGDIFHNSYKDVNNALVDKEFITMWRQRVGECFVCMGNHEFTYYKANPFYTCLSEIESERVRSLGRLTQPTGLVNTLRVVDELHDGNTHFYFNHFGTGIFHPTLDGINIGLFHQELVDYSMKDFGEWTSDYKDFDASGIFSGYDYAFLGHMHMIYGVWKSKGTVLAYLGSLGRTKENEISDTSLERNIPAVIVEDGVFVGIEDNKFNLLDRESCIHEGVIVDTKVKNELKEVVNDARQYQPNAERPVDGVRQHFVELPRCLKMVDDLLVNDFDDRFTELERMCLNNGYRAD